MENLRESGTFQTIDGEEREQGLKVKSVQTTSGEKWRTPCSQSLQGHVYVELEHMDRTLMGDPEFQDEQFSHDSTRGTWEAFESCCQVGIWSWLGDVSVGDS